MFSRIKSLLLFYILTLLICSNLAKFYNVEETESNKRNSESEESSEEDFDQKSGERNVRKNDYDQEDDMYKFFHKGYGDFFKDDKPWSYSEETTEQYSEEQPAVKDDNYEHSLSNEMSFRRKNGNNSKTKNKQDNGDCTITKKDGSTCTVCYNEKTGGKSERCSYSSKPNDVSYAYTHESNYNSKDGKKEPQNAKSKLKRMEKPVKKYPSSIQDQLENESVQEIRQFNHKFSGYQ